MTVETVSKGKHISPGFIWLTGLTLLVYVGMMVFYGRVEWMKIHGLKEVLLWPVTLGLLLLYWKGFLKLKDQVPSFAWMFGLAALLGLVAINIRAFHSTDILGYINRGWEQFHYHMNPYVHPVDDIAGWEQDDMLSNHWVNNPSPYGFLYLQLTKVLVSLGGGRLGQTIRLFKLVNYGLFLATGWLLYKTLRRSGQSDEVSTRAFYLFAWNPLVLVHLLANGHNDLLMGFLNLATGALGWLGLWIGILPALTAATLVKYASLVMVPWAALFLFKQRAGKVIVGGIVLSLGLFWAAGATYLVDWPSFALGDIQTNATVSHGSLHSFLYSGYKTLGTEVFPALVPAKLIVRSALKYLLLGGYTLGFTYWFWKRFRQEEYPLQTWLWDSVLAITLLVCLVSLKFYPWYLGMFLPLALLLPEGNWLRRLVVLISCGQLFSLTFIGQAHFLNFVVMTVLPAGILYWQARPTKAAT